MTDDSREKVAQAIWQMYAADIGKALPHDLADRMAGAAINAITPRACPLDHPVCPWTWHREKQPKPTPPASATGYDHDL